MERYVTCDVVAIEVYLHDLEVTHFLRDRFYPVVGKTKIVQLLET